MAEVLSASGPYDGQPSFSGSPLRRSNSQNSLFSTATYVANKRSTSGSVPPRDHDLHTPDPSLADSSPPIYRAELSRSSSFYSTPPSSICLNSSFDEHDEEICFPSYDDSAYTQLGGKADLPASPAPSGSAEERSSSNSDSTTTNDSLPTSPALAPVHDDTAVHAEPSRQVDYLSHDWREEDIWSSWRHIVSKRRVYGERSRLENASWRTWTKAKYQLKTVSPETLNWLKDCDVTWLYGPLQPGALIEDSHDHHRDYHGQRRSITKNDSFLDKKPILKKRTASEVMLQKSISTSSLVKQAAAVIQAQRVVDAGLHGRRSRPRFERAQSDYVNESPRSHFPEVTSALTYISASSSSGLQSPEAQAARHIRFDDKVEQCIAVDFKNGEAEDEEPEWTKDHGESSEEELVMKARPRRRTSTVGQVRANISQDSKGIAMLPSTTLKYHQDDPTCPGHSGAQSTSWKPGKLVQSASQETLRPSKPSSNFLIDDDGDADVDWEPSGAFSHARKDSIAVSRDRAAELSLAERGEEVGPHGLRRTPSGMFMPFDDEDDEDTLVDAGILGRFVEGVNTARDIAHVIWNVGWRK